LGREKKRDKFMGIRTSQLLDVPKIILPFETTFRGNASAPDTGKDIRVGLLSLKNEQVHFSYR
jgi:hypothetical protein